MTTNVKVEYENSKSTDNTFEGSTLNVGHVIVSDNYKVDETDVVFDVDELKIFKAENISITGHRRITLCGIENLIILVPKNNSDQEVRSIEVRRIQASNK